MRTWRDDNTGNAPVPAMTIDQTTVDTGVIALPPTKNARTITAKMTAIGVGTKAVRLAVSLSNDGTNWVGSDQDETLNWAISTTQAEAINELIIDAQWAYVRFEQVVRIGTYNLALEIA